MEVFECMFLNNPLVKVIRTEAHKLSDLRCVSYHAIHTTVTGGYFITPPLSKVIRTEAHMFLGLRCVSYHAIHDEDIDLG